MNTLYEDFCNGCKLTDTQVLEGYKEFKLAANVLFPLGIAFRVTAKELLKVADRLEEMAVAREIM